MGCESGTDKVAIHDDLRDRVGHFTDFFDDELLLRDFNDYERLLLAETDLHTEGVFIARILVHATGRYALELGRASERQSREFRNTETLDF